MYISKTIYIYDYICMYYITGYNIATPPEKKKKTMETWKYQDSAMPPAVAFRSSMSLRGNLTVKSWPPLRSDRRTVAM